MSTLHGLEGHNRPYTRYRREVVTGNGDVGYTPTGHSVTTAKVGSRVGFLYLQTR